MTRSLVRSMTCAFALCVAVGSFAAPPEGEGWRSLFNGEDLTGWTTIEADPPIWSVVDGVIDCQPRTDVPGEKSLWSEESFGDAVYHIEWRIVDTPGPTYPAPEILPDGNEARDEDGNVIVHHIQNADSGIYLRGQSKAQVNIWCWPIGSGEVYGYRTDRNMPDEVRAGVTPSKNMDNPVGEWNTFIIHMIGDRLTVDLNGERIIENVQLPGVAEEGPIALQHHGGFNPETGEWNNSSSLVQFRNIYVKELD